MCPSIGSKRAARRRWTAASTASRRVTSRGTPGRRTGTVAGSSATSRGRPTCGTPSLWTRQRMNNGGQPVSADSLLGIVPSALLGGARPVAVQFGSDGALYVETYYAAATTRSATQHGRSGASTTSAAPDTPGADPQGDRPADRRARSRSRSASPAASPTSGTSATDRRPPPARPTVSHTYGSGGDKTATADGDLRRRRDGLQDRDGRGGPRPDERGGEHQRHDRRAHGAGPQPRRAAASFGALTPSIDQGLQRDRSRRRC